MQVQASAPGKLVIAGDYAVLEGAPAVVMAVNRRANVTLDTDGDDGFRVNAPDIGVRQAHGHMHGGELHWEDAAMAERLRLVTAVYEHMAGRRALSDSFTAQLDTHDFFSGGARGGKLGLGSSAALTVALVGAIRALRKRRPPKLETMIAMHRKMQGGRGSGLDIAASLLGGVQIYRLRKDRPRVAQATWPSDLALCCVWSGQPASTGKALAHLDLWRCHHPAEYDSLMNELTIEATAVASALKAGDAAAMVDGMAAYASGLARLGKATGIDIMSAEHRAIAAMAAKCGVVYKTCGAGGGDVGVACATDTGRLTEFAKKVNGAGFHVLDIGVDTDGLDVEKSGVRNRRQRWKTCA